MKKSDVVDRIEKGWKLFSETIDEYHDSFHEGHDESDLADNHFLCWEEADVPFQLGRFFYQVKDDGKYDFHVETNLKSRNFDGYKFGDDGSLEKVREKLARSARIDFLVEDGSNDNLSVCEEAKYFRYSIEGVSQGSRNVIEAIDDDFEILKIFVKYGITKNAVYAVLDKYYHRIEPKAWNKIESKLKKNGGDWDYCASEGSIIRFTSFGWDS